MRTHANTVHPRVDALNPLQTIIKSKFMMKLRASGSIGSRYFNVNH